MTHDENISTRLSTSNGNGKCRGTAPTTPGPGVLLAAALLVVAGTTLGFCLLRRHLRRLVAGLIRGRLRPHFVALAQLRLAGQVLDTGDVPDVLADAVADGATLADNRLHVLSRETCCHSSPLLFLGLGDAGRFQSNCYCLLLLAAGLHEFTDVFSNRLSAFALFQRNDALPSQISTPARSRVPTVITQLHSNCLRLGTERATAHATTPGGFMFSVSSVQ